MKLNERTTAALAWIDDQLAICNAATKGPWTAHDGWSVDDNREKTKSEHPDWCEITGAKASLSGHIGFPNAAFIAIARTGYPAMLEGMKVSIEALRDTLDDPEYGGETCDNEGRGCHACASNEKALHEILIKIESLQ